MATTKRTRDAAIRARMDNRLSRKQTMTAAVSMSERQLWTLLEMELREAVAAACRHESLVAGLAAERCLEYAQELRTRGHQMSLGLDL